MDLTTPTEKNMADKKSFWKSLKDYNNDPEFLKAKTNEFVEGVTDDFSPEEMKGLSRRKFLALVTASTAFTAAACTDYPDKGEIIPYTKRPQNVYQGKQTFMLQRITAVIQFLLRHARDAR